MRGLFVPPTSSVSRNGPRVSASQRPFINLDIYAARSSGSTPVTRLKSEVDDVVTVTNAHLADTYDQLVTALNSNHYSYTTIDSVIMYRNLGTTAYIQQAVTMMDKFIDSENVLINAGSNPIIAGDSYLEVGQYMEQIATAYDYGYSLLTPAQRTKWETYCEQAIWNVWNYASAVWSGFSHPWSGWSVSDPGNNYHFSFIKATMLWAIASQSSTWQTFLENNKFGPLVSFYASLTGGGTREGTGYGTSVGALFEDYQYWKASKGYDLSAQSTHARDTIDYWIHASTPDFHYYCPIGDQARDATGQMFDYQRKLVQFGVALNLGTVAAERGTWFLNNMVVSDGGGGWVSGQMRYNYDYKFDLLTDAGTSTAPTVTLYNATGVGAVFARSGWTTNSSFMHTVCGPYDQSHGHQDQGSFSFYRADKGGWLTNTANARSQSGINQTTDLHNIIRFMNGGSIVGQNYCTCTKSVSDDGTSVTVDMSRER